ncbi:MAG: VOC family protein [Bacteroidetes bacterium]|nr:VOC family protein [Bacteroidota bacterium]
MKHKIYPCLWFDGKAKEAADFYCSAFKNANIAANNPMVTTCEIEGKLMMGLNGGPMFTMNPSISMVVMAETKDDANKIWNSLLEGGKVMIALEKHPWSELYGWLQDKYGFTWQISLATKENPGFKITPCLLFTKEQFGRAEEAMNYYTSAFNNSSVGMKVLYPEQDENAGKLMYAEFNIVN